MHFFNPAPLMALVEIVSGLATDRPWPPPVRHRRLGQPVHTRSTPGFIVNRVARPFYAESLRLLQEGAADCATLDALLRDAGGFRMGASN
jgi:3-hydroxybutyryl-CoA dehydrogenase